MLKYIGIARLVPVLMCFALAGCCLDDGGQEARQESPAQVEVAPPEAKAADAPVVDGGGLPVPAESILEIPMGEEAPAQELKSALLEGQEAADRLHELDPQNLTAYLEKDGWAFESASGEEIEGGHRFIASREDKSVQIDLVTLASVDAADKFLFELERDEEVSFGRANNKFLVVHPREGAGQPTSFEVLKALMPRKVTKAAPAPEVDAGSEAPPEGFDPENPVEEQ